MVYKTIELTSTYRDRNMYPEAADFVGDFGRSTTKASARDPIINAAPLLSFTQNGVTSSIFNLNSDILAPQQTLSGTVTNVGITSDRTVVVAFPVNEASHTENYYRGSVLRVFADSLGSHIEESRLLYTDAGFDAVLFVLDNSVSSMILGQGVIIENSSFITDLDNPAIFIPTGVRAANYYVNYWIMNNTRNEYRPIISYIGNSSLAFLDTSTEYGGPISAAWTRDDDYTLRKGEPMVTGIVSDPVTTTFATDTLTTGIQINNSTFTLPSTNATSLTQLEDFVLNITSGSATGQSRTIKTYNNGNQTGTLQTGFGVTINPGDTYTITTNTAYTDVNTIVIPSTSSFAGNNLTGDFIRITSGNNIEEMRRISSYDNNPFSPTYRYLTFATNLPNSLVANTDTFEILGFTDDSYHPLSYNGSRTSQQQMTCYEIELLDLVLPNQTLAVHNGSRITFYPYVYVELSNVSTRNTSILYSNNPNSVKATFRAAVTDVPNPVVSSFVKLDGNGAVHTFKFKPNDSLRLRVTLPNGEVFKTVLDEQFSPNEPNPLIQISALFQFKRTS